MLTRRGLLKNAAAMPLLAALSYESSLRGEPLPLVDYGVASGEPTQSSIVLWTRVPEYAQCPGEVEVEFEVSRDDAFVDIVATGLVRTSCERDFTVRVKVCELDAYTRYFYRFRTQTGYSSVVGRTQTAPTEEMDLQSIRFAFVSCQNFSAGYFTPFETLANEELDFCIHLGDNIYETDSVGPGVRRVRRDPIADAQTLNEYRSKYKLALSDPYLREVRRKFAWISLWDDHEVCNNYTANGSLAPTPERKRVAYQAFMEYIPRALPGIQGEYYRTLNYGRLANLICADERQYRDSLACYVDGKRDLFVKSCNERFEPRRTMLGNEQRVWLKQRLSASETKWTFLLNEVLMMQLKFYDRMAGRSLWNWGHDKVKPDESGIFFSFDGWDGFPEERADLLSFVGDIELKNFVVLTGDIHNYFAGGLKPSFSRLQEKNVGVEVVGGSVTSAGIADVLHMNVPRVCREKVLRLNPHMRFLDFKYHGYVRAHVTSDFCRFDFIGVDSIYEPKAQPFLMKSLFVKDGESEIY